MRTQLLLVAGAAVGAVALAAPPALHAQRPPSPPEPRASITVGTPAPANRAVVGLLLAEGNGADTLGVRIEEVTSGGPAANAGVRAGDRVVAVNGRDVRLNASEARDPAQRGLGVRRLTRALADVEPGDEVTLRVRGESGERTLTMRAVRPSALPDAAGADWGPRAFGLGGRDSSAAIGLAVQATGTPRDTLGAFVASVVSGGPAESAGIYEGDRIVSVGTTDLRVTRADADDPYVAGLKADQLTRAVRDARIGQPLTMRVWRAGQVRTVDVTPRPAADVYEGETMGGSPFSFDFDGGGVRIRAGRPDGASSELRRMIVPRSGEGARIFRFDGGDGTLRFDGEMDAEIRARVDDAMRRVRIFRDSGGTELRILGDTADGRIRIFRDSGNTEIRVIPRADARTIPRSSARSELRVVPRAGVRSERLLVPRSEFRVTPPAVRAMPSTTLYRRQVRRIV